MTEISVDYTAQKMKFSINDFFSKCEQIRKTVDLVIFTEEILNGKLHFFSSVNVPLKICVNRYLRHCHNTLYKAFDVQQQ